MAQATMENVSVETESAPRAVSREKTPAERPSKTVSQSPSASTTKRRHSSHTKHKHSSKKARSKRSKFSRSYSTSGSSESSSSTSSSSDTESDFSSRQNNSSCQIASTSGELDYSLDTSIVDFAAEAAFNGLSKNARKDLLKDTPMPHHADLRPKKVDSFVKKYLKRNGTPFNPVMDRRQMNIAGRILDPLGPLAQLWQKALLAEQSKTGLDPAEVVELVQRAVALTGNASFCALADRRKGLLAKISSDSLDLLEDQSLFSQGSTDLFGKKFKKSFLKELKLSKELDSLVGRARYHGNNKSKPFRFQPGKGPGFNTRPWGQRFSNRGGQHSYRRGKSHATQFARPAENKI
ncbi:uncharacterized protein LOC114524096 [Dendronephthya gigantea]|uniref:uncharacterized protein LOC114524096 n=1 Tax=Dendronephthya gigantea TaxID=151771 RepID=UPI001068ED4D|nr:uncharacterized protein LOC114524096 [Dendronephthya gigantea]